MLFNCVKDDREKSRVTVLCEFVAPEPANLAYTASVHQVLTAGSGHYTIELHAFGDGHTKAEAVKAAMVAFRNQRGDALLKLADAAAPRVKRVLDTTETKKKTKKVKLKK